MLPLVGQKLALAAPQLGTTLHEMSHILGFSSSKFNDFYNITDGTKNVSVILMMSFARRVINKLIHFSLINNVVN